MVELWYPWAYIFYILIHIIIVVNIILNMNYCNIHLCLVVFICLILQHQNLSLHYPLSSEKKECQDPLPP